MKNIKAIGLLISLVLIFSTALPGTFAVSADFDSAKDAYVFDETGETQETTSADLVNTEPVCSCGSEDSIHAEDCPLYTAPYETEDPERGTEESTQEENESGLYEQLMACESAEEIYDILDGTSEEELMALTDEEIDDIDEKLAAFEAQMTSAEPEYGQENESVISEIIYPAVNFDYVAPFGEPVEG